MTRTIIADKFASRQARNVAHHGVTFALERDKRLAVSEQRFSDVGANWHRAWDRGLIKFRDIPPQYR